MANSNSEQLLKLGQSPEQWIEMWESGFTLVKGRLRQTSFTHDHSQQSDPASAGGGHHHHQHGEHEEHGHGTVSEADKHGNMLKVDSYLLRNIHNLTGGNPDEKILVSLCGDTKDLEWLCSSGYAVVGAELSEKAVRQAFDNACAGPIPYDMSTKGEIKVYSATDGKNLKVYVGDFFKDGICPQELGKFNCIWDSHGIVSLPVSLHQAYADKLLTFLNPGGKILFSTVDYDLTKLKKGPAPAPVPCSKLTEYFPNCNVQQLEKSIFKHGKFEGLDIVYNPVVLVVAP